MTDTTEPMTEPTMAQPLSPGDLYALVSERLLAGEDPATIAASLDLDTADESRSQHESWDGLAVVLPGWIADDGNAEVDYPDAASGLEAAREYVESGDWGEVESTQWVTVYAWRVALARDEDGDIVDVTLDRDSHSIGIDPEEPECPCADRHKWSDDHSLVGGCESNPGCFARGGGAICHYVCVYCGLERRDNSWAQNPETGEQGLDSVSYEEDMVDADGLAHHWRGQLAALQAAVDDDGLDLDSDLWRRILGDDRRDAGLEESISYVRCLYGTYGDEPGDCEVQVRRGALRWWLQDGDDGCMEHAGEDLGYPTQEAALEAAQEIADEQHEGEVGEDADAMIARQRREAQDRASADGRWIVAWCDGTDLGPGVTAGRRYEDRADAEAEIASWYDAVLSHTPNALTHLMVHPVLAELVDGELVEIEVEDAE
jgi:hypothetical protein